MSTYLANLSDEERKEFIQQAREAREKKRIEGIAYAEQFLKTDWADEPYWKELASKHGIRMPTWWEKADTKNMRKIVKKLGKDSAWFAETTGFSKYKDHEKANPRMNCQAFLGFMLEEIEDELANVSRETLENETEVA